MGQKIEWRRTTTTSEAEKENQQEQVQKASMSNTLQSNIFNKLTMQAENPIASEEANQMENIAQENQNRLEQRSWIN